MSLRVATGRRTLCQTSSQDCTDGHNHFTQKACPLKGYATVPRRPDRSVHSLAHCAILMFANLSRRRNHMSTQSHVGRITYRHQTAEVGSVPLRMDSGTRKCVAPEVLECGMSVYVFAMFAVFAVFAVFACGCSRGLWLLYIMKAIARRRCVRNNLFAPSPSPCPSPCLSPCPRPRHRVLDRVLDRVLVHVLVPVPFTVSFTVFLTESSSSSRSLSCRRSPAAPYRPSAALVRPPAAFPRSTLALVRSPAAPTRSPIATWSHAGPVRYRILEKPELFHTIL
jgi:hypothetical protein